MKLLTYDTGAGPHDGVLDSDDVVDATALLGAASARRDRFLASMAAQDSLHG